MVSPILRNTLFKMGIAYRGNVTDMRKAAATLTCCNDPAITDKMAQFMGHSRKTHESIYRVQVGDMGLSNAFTALEHMQSNPHHHESGSTSIYPCSSLDNFNIHRDKCELSKDHSSEIDLSNDSLMKQNMMLESVRNDESSSSDAYLRVTNPCNLNDQIRFVEPVQSYNLELEMQSPIEIVDSPVMSFCNYDGKTISSPIQITSSPIASEMPSLTNSSSNLSTFPRRNENLTLDASSTHAASPDGGIPSTPTLSISPIPLSQLSDENTDLSAGDHSQTCSQFLEDKMEVSQMESEEDERSMEISPDCATQTKFNLFPESYVRVNNTIDCNLVKQLRYSSSLQSEVSNPSTHLSNASKNEKEIVLKSFSININSFNFELAKSRAASRLSVVRTRDSSRIKGSLVNTSVFANHSIQGLTRPLTTEKFLDKISRRSIFKNTQEELIFQKVFCKYIQRVKSKLSVSKLDTTLKAKSSHSFAPVLKRLLSVHKEKTYQKIYMRVRTSGNSKISQTIPKMDSLASPSKSAHHRSLFLHESDEILFRTIFSDFIQSVCNGKTVRRVDILQRAHTNDLFKLLMSQLGSSNQSRNIENAIVSKVRTMGNSLRRGKYNSSNVDSIH